MPSPAMATTLPCPCSLRMISNFLSGNTSASNSSMPSFVAMAAAVARLSPVSITMRMPWFLSARIASGVDDFSGSTTENVPRYFPSAATKRVRAWS